jgi:ribosomal protein S4
MSRIKINEGDEAVFVINGKEITVSKLTVSPTSAEEIINKSDSIFSNRKSREASYKLYAQDMAKGEWKTNGETIKFSDDGALLDGRNRLCAVTLGKKNIDFIAIGNIDRSVVDTIDIGMKRTLEHVLKMQGYSYETGSAAIVKTKLELDSRQMSQGASEAALNISRLNAVHEYENNIDKYNKASEYGKDIWTISHKALNRPEVGALYMHLTETLKWDCEVVKEFFNKLATPAEKTIFFTTYDKLNNKKVCRGKERFKEYIICWNSYITGKKTQRISYKDGDWFISPN